MASNNASIASRASVARRLGLAAIVVVGEYVVATLVVDFGELPFEGGLAWALSWLAALAPLAVVAAAAALLFAPRRLANIPVQAELTLRAWLPHLASLLVYVATTYLLVTQASAPLLALWLATALALGATALRATLPGPALVSAIRPLAPAAGIAAAAWAAGLAAQSLWPLLAQLTLGIVEELAFRTWNDVAYVPEAMLIGTYRFNVTVAPTCSGLEGLGLMAVLVGGYLWWRRAQLRWPRAWWALLLALALVFLGNALRIYSLIAIGTHVSSDLALGAFHSKAGWLFFCLIAVGTAFWLERSPFWLKLASRQANERYENPVAAYVVPLLCLMGTAMVTSPFADPLDWAYGARLVAAGTALGYFAPKLTPLAWSAWKERRSLLLGVAVGCAAFAAWWLFTAPAWLPGFALLTPRPTAVENAALVAPLLPLSSASSVAWIAVRALGAVIVVPVVEELAFRGFVLRRIIQRDFDRVPLTQLHGGAVFVSSVVFGLLHGAWLAGTACGIMYAWAQHRSGSLVAPIVAHAVTNALLTAYVLASGQWWQWL